MSLISLKLVADSRQLIATLQGAQTHVNAFTRATETAGHSLGGGVNQALQAFQGLAKGGAAAAGVLAGAVVSAAVGITALTLHVGAQAEAVDQLSQKTGIAARTIQGWSVIMAENNFSAESLATSMRTLSKNIRDAHNPASQAAFEFEQMGISINQLGSTESTILAVADKFRDMADGPEKARIAVALFGKSGLDLIPILNRGAAAFEESRKMAERYGAVLTGSQLASLTAVDDAADRLTVAFQGLKNSIALAFAPNVEAAINRVTDSLAMLTNVTRNYNEALEQIKKEHPIIASLSPATAAAMAAVRAAQMPPPGTSAGFPVGSDQSSHVDEMIRAGEKQEELGRRLLVQHLGLLRTDEARKKAQEELGRVIVQIIQRETKERNAAFAAALEQQEAIENLQFEKVDTGAAKAFDDQLKAVDNLVKLFPELTRHEASLLAIHNAQVASGVLQASKDRLETLAKTAHQLAIVADTEQAWADNAAAAYNRLGPLLGDAMQARAYAMDAIDARTASSMATLDSELARGLILWDEYYARIVQLDLRADAQKKALAMQYPTFMQKQMQDLVNSNSFSLSQITGNFTNATAQWIMTGQNFSQFWQSLQLTLVQAFLNTLVQMFANWVLHSTLMETGAAAMEAAKTKIFGVGEATRLAISKTNAKLMVASNMAALAGMGAMGKGAVAIMSAVMLAASAMMAAIAGALAAGIVTAEMAPAVAAASGALALGANTMGPAALAGIAAVLTAAGTAMGLGEGLGFSTGGIGNFGSGTPATLHGPEAIIPLNSRGASFLQDAMGMGGGAGSLTVPVILDGQEIGRAVVENLPRALRGSGVPLFGAS